MMKEFLDRKDGVFNLPEKVSIQKSLLEDLKLIKNNKFKSKDLLLDKMVQFVRIIDKSNIFNKDIDVVVLKKMFNSNYILIRDLLENNSIIEVNHFYTFTDYSQVKRYKISDKYLEDTKYVSYLTSSKKYYNKLIREDFKNRQEVWKNTLARTSVKTCLNIDFKTLDWFSNKAKELNKVGYRTKGRELVYKKDKQNEKSFIINTGNKPFKYNPPKTYAIIEEHLTAYDRLIGDGTSLPIPVIKRRVYSVLNLIPKWIRLELTIRGQRFKSIDLPGAHINILLNDLLGSKISYSHNDIVKYIISLGDTRDYRLIRNEVKINILKWLNSKSRYKKDDNLRNFDKGNIKKYFDKYYPGFTSAILQHRNDSKLPIEEKHKATSRYAIDKEVQIFTNLINKLPHLEDRLMPIHDEVMCLEENYDEVKTTLKEVLKEMNYNNFNIN